MIALHDASQWVVHFDRTEIANGDWISRHVLDHRLSPPEVAQLERVQYLKPPTAHLQ